MTDFDDEAPVAESTSLHDHAAEAATLGAMLLDKTVIAEVQQLVTAGSFHKPAHQRLFAALASLHDNSQPTDPVSFVAHLAGTGVLSAIPGGSVYVLSLIERVPTAANGPHFAGIVADRALLRDLDAGCMRIRQMIRDGGSGTSAELVERARLLFAELAGRTAATDGPVHWNAIISEGLDAMEKAEQSGDGPTGIPTGLPDLDKVIHGLQDERLIVVAGRPGAGKSILTSDLVRAAAFDRKVPTLLFNMEMPRLEIFNRLVCAHAVVEHDRVVGGTMTDRDWTAIARVCGDTGDAPLWIDDTKGMTLADIRVRAHKFQKMHGIRLVIVDYLGLIAARGNEPRHQQVGEIARGLKTLAGELKVPVVLCAQLNRNAAQRTDKRPGLTDLAESGQIEAHADVVIFVHREEQYDKTKRKGEADLIVAKNRAAAATDVVVAAQLHLTRFASIALP